MGSAVASHRARVAARQVTIAMKQDNHLGGLDQEMRDHIDAEIVDNLARGMKPDEARRKAFVRFGSLTAASEETYNVWYSVWLQQLRQDVRYALRQLIRNRAFTLTAVITLGLGMGATTAMFSAVYSLLLRPLPYRAAAQLMSISSVWPASQSDSLISPDFVAAQNGTKSFEEFAGYYTGNDNLSGRGDPKKVIRASVTANFFNVLGVRPELGRGFLQGEDRADGPPVILLSDHLWRDKLDADPDIVGRSAILNGEPKIIVGVLPPHFIFPDLTVEPDYYAPPPLDANTTVSIEKPVFGLKVIARLRPGVSIGQAQAETQTFFQSRARSYPVAMASFGKDRRMVVESLQRHLTGADRRPLYILLASVVAVLLIACANVANLQLARAVARRHETALRGALGASRFRLIRQSLVESLLLSTLAAVMGLVIGYVVIALIRHVGAISGSQPTSPIGQILRLPFGKLSGTVHIDAWVLAFTGGITLATTLLCGLAPAISGSRTDLRNALQSAALRITSGREQRLLRHTLLIFEVSLAVVLLSSAGLLVRSFVNVLHYDSGFDPSNTLTAVTLISGQKFDPSDERILGFVDQVLPRLSGLPGVQAATIASALPLESTFANSAILYEGVATPPIGTWPTLSMISITNDYFRVVGTAVTKGRSFNTSDRKGAGLVAIVNMAFAKRFFAGEALDKRFKANIGGASAYDFRPFTIVGIAEDVRHGGLEQEVQPEAFVPMAQVPQGRVSIALRTSENPDRLANALRHAVAAIDSNQPLFDVQTMEERISGAVAQRRLIMFLITCFAALAVILSVVGVYGVFAYTMSQRTQEIGIRLALGSSRQRVLQIMMKQAAWLIVLGGTIGVGAALVSSKLLASFLVGVTAHDPLTLAVAWAMMTIFALLASSVPAVQASRTDLVSVLRRD